MRHTRGFWGTRCWVRDVASDVPRSLGRRDVRAAQSRPQRRQQAGRPQQHGTDGEQPGVIFGPSLHGATSSSAPPPGGPMPSTMPTVVVIEFSRQEAPRMSARPAPSARRVPICLVRSATENDVRPMMPRAVTNTRTTITSDRRRTIRVWLPRKRRLTSGIVRTRKVRLALMPPAPPRRPFPSPRAVRASRAPGTTSRLRSCPGR